MEQGFDSPWDYFYKMYKDLNIIGPFVAATLILIVVSAGIMFYENPSDGSLIINFDYREGKPFLGDLGTIWNILYIALFIAAINFFLTRALYHRDRFASYLISYANLGVLIIAASAILIIFSMN